MIDSHFAPSFFSPPVVCTFAVGLWALIPCEVSAGACSGGYRAPGVSEPDSAAQASQGATGARPRATALNGVDSPCRRARNWQVHSFAACQLSLPPQCGLPEVR